MKKKNNKEKFYSTQIKNISGNNEDYRKIISLLVILLIITALIAFLFYFNGKFVSKDKFQDGNTTTTSEVVYDHKNILASQIFNRSDKEYYVLLYDKTDENDNALYGNLASSFNKENIKLYTVNMSLKPNSKYYNEEGKDNEGATKVEELSITKPTLIIIKDGKVEDYITDKDEIVKKLS